MLIINANPRKVDRLDAYSRHGPAQTGTDRKAGRTAAFEQLRLARQGERIILISDNDSYLEIVLLAAPGLR